MTTTHARDRIARSDLSTEEAPRETTMEEIHTAKPVTNTFHNIIQTLSIKIDSAARYGLYEADARDEGPRGLRPPIRRARDQRARADRQAARVPAPARHRRALDGQTAGWAPVFRRVPTPAPHAASASSRFRTRPRRQTVVVPKTNPSTMPMLARVVVGDDRPNASTSDTSPPMTTIKASEKGVHDDR